MDYNKMKVNDLKAELASRNLDTKGVKAVLVERLKEAIEKESVEKETESTPLVPANKKLDVGTPNQSTPVRRSRRRSMTRSPSPAKVEIPTLESVVEEPDQTDSTEISSARKKRRTRSITKSPSPVKTGDVQRLEVLQEEHDVSVSEPVNSEVRESSSETKQLTPVKQPTPAASTDVTPIKRNPKIEEGNTTSNEASVKEPATPTTKQTNDSNSNKNNAETGPNEQPDKSFIASEESLEVHDESSEKDPDTVPDESEEKAIAENAESESHETHKRKSSSPAKDSSNKTARTKPAQAPITFVAEEVEPTVEADTFALSWFDSDLNLEINSGTQDSAKPLSEGALALVWAGARANFGVTKGKVMYEVKLTGNNATSSVADEPVTCEFRVGWSTAEANLQLGEAKASFAYANDGMKVTDSKFEKYGCEYKLNDVIGVYLDMDSAPCKIEYTINNVEQGVAFEFEKTMLDGKVLFPHVCSKNIAFKINFGQCERSLLNDRQNCNEEKKDETDENATLASKEEQTNKEEDNAETRKEDCQTSNEDASLEGKSNEHVEQILCVNSDYIYIGKTENVVESINKRPENRKDCEVIFLIGLPSSGKTHWVQNYLKDNPDKRFTVLSVDTLLDRMKVLGEPRQPSNTTKWSKLVEQLSKSLNKLNEIAAKRRRNFILDQTNVFASEQRRRLRGFGEFSARRAVVVIPDEEEYGRRSKLKSDKFGTEVQEGILNAMKAHFNIPTLEQEWFTEITFVELEEEKAREMIKKLNVAGRKTLLRFNRNQQQQRRGSANNNQRWNQAYGNNRQHYQQGGYSPHQRYNNSQFSQSRNYRPGNGYGRQDTGGYSAGRYGNQGDWTRNSGRFGNRYNNRGGYQGNQNRRFDGNRSDYRGYNNGSGWNQQNSNCWSYGSQGNDTQQWYSWWQSNLKNLLQQHGGSGSDNNSTQQANMEQYWSQYAQQHNYGNYQQPKSHGAGSSSKNK